MLYDNDICNIYNSCRSILFADDTTIVSARHYVDILYSQINIELTKVWFGFSELSLNIDKTNYMLFSSKQDQPNKIKNIDTIELKECSLANIPSH